MKNFKLFFYGFLVSGLFLMTSCGEEDPLGPIDETKDIVGTAMDADNLSTLVEALTQADLVSALQGDGPFTVFAPTNDAFQELLDSNPNWNSLSDIDNATLTNVLKFHVIEGSVKSSGLSDSYVSTLASGPNMESIKLRIDVTGGVQFNSSANPVTTDIETTNGTVHIIDKVMLPPSVVDIAVNNDNFSMLVAALTRDDLSLDYVQFLSGEGPFTVFAPTNEAFMALIGSNDDWDSLDDIPVATLSAVLDYHVIGANVQSDELTDGQTVMTVGGNNITFDLSDGAKIETGSGQSVAIIITDVQGANGVVHAVSQVLIP